MTRDASAAWPSTELHRLNDLAHEAESEALIALNALRIAVDASVAADVKAKVVAAFKANADFVRACADFKLEARAVKESEDDLDLLY